MSEDVQMYYMTTCMYPCDGCLPTPRPGKTWGDSWHYMGGITRYNGTLGYQSMWDSDGIIKGI